MIDNTNDMWSAERYSYEDELNAFVERTLNDTVRITFEGYISVGRYSERRDMYKITFRNPFTNKMDVVLADTRTGAINRMNAKVGI
jgi:hypothetical protein